MTMRAFPAILALLTIGTAHSHRITRNNDGKGSAFQPTEQHDASWVVTRKGRIVENVIADEDIAFEVHGAGVEELNGLYKVDGARGGRPMYSITTGGRTARVYYGASGTAWYMWSGTGKNFEYFAKVADDDNLPPVDGWEVYGDGVSPVPQIAILKATTPAITQAPPSRIAVFAPLHSDKSGDYELLDATANGKPLWKHVDSDYWLYSTTKNYWAIGGKDVSDKSFQSKAGFIVTTESHRDRLPTAMTGLWMQVDVDGTKLIASDQITVTSTEPEATKPTTTTAITQATTTTSTTEVRTASSTHASVTTARIAEKSKASRSLGFTLLSFAVLGILVQV